MPFLGIFFFVNLRIFAKICILTLFSYKSINNGQIICNINLLKMNFKPFLIKQFFGFQKKLLKNRVLHIWDELSQRVNKINLRSIANLSVFRICNKAYQLSSNHCKLE